MTLRRPYDTLTGCRWLPRFIDEARHHLAGTLPPDYRIAFCSPQGVDGFFLRHFGLAKDEILAVVRREGSDEGVAAWFVARPDADGERIRTWNELAPKIRKPGFPGHRTPQ